MMKILLLAAILALAPSSGADEIEIGSITSAQDLSSGKPDVTVNYEYDGKGKLVLSLQNIAMNAAAKGVIGELFVKGGEIVIRPKERYDSQGPVESTRCYTIRYVIQNVQPGLYSLNHDDSAAEGQDRETKAELDLRIAGKGRKIVKFKVPDPSDDPFAGPTNTKATRGDVGKPASEVGTPADAAANPQEEVSGEDDKGGQGKGYMKTSGVILDLCVYEQEFIPAKSGKGPPPPFTEATLITRAVVTGVHRGKVKVGTKIEIKEIVIDPPEYLTQFRSVVEGRLLTYFYFGEKLPKAKDGCHLVDHNQIYFDRDKDEDVKAFLKELDAGAGHPPTAPKPKPDEKDKPRPEPDKAPR